MIRTLLRTTAFALAALALTGCGSGGPVGPDAPSDRPSLANVGPGDRNGNGWICGRQISDVGAGGVIGGVIGGDVGTYAAPGYVLVDDRDGVCPAGFRRLVPV